MKNVVSKVNLLKWVRSPGYEARAIWNKTQRTMIFGQDIAPNIKEGDTFILIERGLLSLPEVVRAEADIEETPVVDIIGDGAPEWPYGTYF